MKNINLTKVLLYSTLLFSVAAPAHANIGSAIVAASWTHIMILNFLIALVESIAAVWLLRNAAFRIRYLKQNAPECVDGDCSDKPQSQLRLRLAYTPILIANLLSAFLGFFIFMLLAQCDFSWIPLYTVRYLFVLGALAAFALTVLMEWPFMKYLISDSKLVFAKPKYSALVLCLVINVISYIGLVFFYKSVGDTSVVTQATYDHTASFLKNKSGHVYYTGADSRGVYRMKLDGSDKEMLRGIADRLEVVPGKRAGFWDLKSVSGRVIAPEFSQKTTNVGYGYKATSRQNLEKINANSIYSLHLRELRDKNDRNYDIERRELMVYSGLTAINKRTGKRQDIGLETVFSLSITSDVNLLPDDIIIWSLGNRILAYDLKNNRVTQLARGGCPVVTLD